MPKMTLDQIDCKILDRLQSDARLANTDLAQDIGLSPSPASRRVRQLEAQGVIKGYVTLLDPAAVGLPVSVFISVSLEHQVEKDLNTFEKAVQSYPEVMECYLMTGDSDYLLRVVVPDIEAYQHFVLERLTRIPGVSSIRSSFALKQVSYRTALPLTHMGPEV